MATLSSNSASTSTQLSRPAKDLSEEKDRRRKSSVHEGPAYAKLGSNGSSQGYSITASHQRISGNIWANSSAVSPVSSAGLRKLQPHRTNLLALFSICYAQRRHTTGAFLTSLKRTPSGVPNAGSQVIPAENGRCSLEAAWRPEFRVRTGTERFPVQWGFKA